METLKTQTQSLVENHLAEIFARLGIKGEITSTLQDGTLRVEAKTDHDELLLNRGADPLLALQHLLRIIFKQSLAEDSASLILNIGDFHDQQQSQLTAIARETAEQVAQSQQPQLLRPMSSYERRVVHMVLADHPAVESVSEGEGTARRILIRPKS